MHRVSSPGSSPPARTRNLRFLSQRRLSARLTRSRRQFHIAVWNETLVPDLNPQVLQLDFGDMSVGVSDVDGFLMPVYKEALHAIIGVLAGVVAWRRVIRLRPGIDPVAVSE